MQTSTRSAEAIRKVKFFLLIRGKMKYFLFNVSELNQQVMDNKG